MSDSPARVSHKLNGRVQAAVALRGSMLSSPGTVQRTTMTRRRDPYEERPAGRTEPTLGDLSGLDAEQAEPAASFSATAGERLAPAPPPPRHRRTWVVVVLLLLAAVVAVAWINQGRLRGMVPRTALNDVLGRAQQALQQGHLVGSDGSSARELFQAVLAMEPDNDAALKGLQQVGRDLVADADASLRAGQVQQAALQAAQARELLGGGSDLDQLDRRIQAARAPGPATPDLVARAQQALAAGKLGGADGAAALYAEIARADPGSAVARHGLDQVGVALATRAQQALDAHELAAADALIQQLATLQPSNGALPGLRAALTQAQGAAPAGATTAAVAGTAAATAPAPSSPSAPPAPAVDANALAAELDQAQAALRAGRIAGAGDDTALAHYRAALKLDPDNAAARDGLRLVARALTVQANVAIDLHDGARAASLLDQAAALDPDSAQVAAARARLGPPQRGDTAVKMAGDDANAGLAMAAPMELTPQQRAEIADLVRKAKAATQRGDIMMPPGDSAYDLYRSALAINGNDPSALQGMHDLPDQVRARFQGELSAGRLAAANNALADYAALSPNDARHAAMATRLAGAWLDQARQRLAQGDRAGAAQALDRARRLAPNDPRVAELSAQLARS